MNTSKEILEQLETPVNVKRLIDKLAFDLDNFEQANLEQPRLYLEAGRYRTWAVLEKARAEFKLETTTAETGLSLRQKNEGTKRTEKAIADLTLTTSDVKVLSRKYYLAKAADEWSKQLVEAYNHRLQVLGNITKIRSAETSSNLRAIKEKAAVETVRREASKMRQRYDRERE